MICSSADGSVTVSAPQLIVPWSGASCTSPNDGARLCIAAGRRSNARTRAASSSIENGLAR